MNEVTGPTNDLRERYLARKRVREGLQSHLEYSIGEPIQIYLEQFDAAKQEEIMRAAAVHWTTANDGTGFIVSIIMLSNPSTQVECDHIFGISDKGEPLRQFAIWPPSVTGAAMLYQFCPTCGLLLPEPKSE